MTIPFPPVVVLMVIATIATAWMLGASIVHRDRPRIVYFQALSCMGFLWCFLALLYNLLEPGVLQHVVLDLRYIPIALIPVTWLMFSAVAAGFNPIGIRRTTLLACVPVMSLFLLATNDFHHLVFEGLRTYEEHPGIGHYRGSWFWVHTAYSYTLMVAGLVLIWARLVRSTHRKATVLMIGGAVTPFLLNAAYVFNEQAFAYIDPSPIGLGAAVAVYGVAILRYDALDLIPVGHSRIVDAMTEARIVFTDRGRILDANNAAVGLFGDRIELGRPAVGVIRELWERRCLAGICEEVELGGRQAEWPGWFEIDLQPVLRDPHQPIEEPTHWVLRVWDVRRRKATETALEHRVQIAEAQTRAALAAIVRVRDLFGPKLRGIEGLNRAMIEDLDGEPAVWSELTAEAAENMRGTLATILKRAGLEPGPTLDPLESSLVPDPRKGSNRDSNASGEQSKMPSPAPESHSGADRRANDRPATDRSPSAPSSLPHTPSRPRP
ncbi:MAG: hypothetical protein JJ896_07020 [Rhodothermales bacterium]|nr:hypothetical protein [Rhodothermales bacterium]MBO6779389.1 hypothetical protein [Rhodothermales bacterium]